MTLLQPMVAGLLQGLQEFTYLSGLTVLSTVLKAIGVFVVISFFYSLNNVLIAILGSIVIIYFLTVILFKKLSDKIPTKNNKAISSVLLPNFWQLTLVTLLFNSLINADILLARRFLISIEAGMYALQMNLARSVLLVPSTLAPIMYSLTSETAIKKEKGSSISNQTIVVTIILGIGAVIFLKLFSQTIFTSIFNKSISLDNNHVWIMALAMTMYGLSDIMIHYLLSQNKTSILVPLFLISMTQVILILFNHHSIFEISMIILLINGLLFFCSFLFYTEHIKKAK